MYPLILFQSMTYYLIFDMVYELNGKKNICILEMEFQETEFREIKTCLRLQVPKLYGMISFYFKRNTEFEKKLKKT